MLPKIPAEENERNSKEQDRASGAGYLSNKKRSPQPTKHNGEQATFKASAILAQQKGNCNG